jgi:hypothetical protein
VNVVVEVHVHMGSPEGWPPERLELKGVSEPQENPPVQEPPHM